MHLEQLETRSFRNLADQAFVAHSRFNIISGDNAQGKTNLLEAVYLAGCLSSFRAAKTVEMVRFGAESAVVRARLRAGGMQRMLEVRLDARGRRAAVDGKVVRSAASYLGRLNVVLFAPEDLVVPRGSPAERRKLLDRGVQAVWPEYVRVLRDYERALRSRNRLLRERPARLAGLLDVYDAQLADQGARVVAARERYLETISPRLAAVFSEIARSGVAAIARYRRRGSGEASEQGETGRAPEGGDSPGRGRQRVAVLREELGALLAAARGEDQVRRVTTVGPHGDDVDLLLDGRSTRSYGSQGQLRALVLALRIAQIQDAKERLGHYPVLLLDDVSSELDQFRNDYLYDFLKQIDCQIFVTTARPELVPVGHNCSYFQAVNGQVTLVE